MACDYSLRYPVMDVTVSQHIEDDFLPHWRLMEMNKNGLLYGNLDFPNIMSHYQNYL